jgi:hypothetical protein
MVVCAAIQRCRNYGRYFQRFISNVSLGLLAYNRLTVMAFLREVQCHNCRRRTRHLYSLIQRIIKLQSPSLEGDSYTNYACPSCNHLTRSRVEPAGKIFERPDDLTVYAVYLECEKTRCDYRVILLAPLKIEICEADLLAHIEANWKTHGALCADNFAPIRPYEVRIWKKLEEENYYPSGPRSAW